MWQRFLGLIGLSLALHSPAHAGDVAQLDFIGFSKDGKHLAFEQYGVTDGQGAPYSEIYFIDVPGNAYAAKPLLINPQDGAATSLERVRADNRAQAKSKLAELGIDGKTTGKHLIAHGLHNLGADLHQVRFTPDYPTENAAYRAYQLDLEERATNTDCFGFGKARVFTLKLTNQDRQAVKVLQKDDKVPSSRGCPFNYRIQDVYLHGDQALAVFLNLYSPGFEGRNVRYLVVTGELN